jgi:hypothetical protein
MGEQSVHDREELSRLNVLKKNQNVFGFVLICNIAEFGVEIEI